MCGIYGMDIANCKFKNRQLAMLHLLLAQANESRGSHSWGYYDLGHREISKGIGSIVKKVNKISYLKRFFAHTRHATHGKICNENAHPFKIGNVIGVHNGVLSNHSSLNMLNNRDFEVDSMHLFDYLANKYPLSEIEGYGSIAYAREKSDDLMICKMRSGELAVFEVYDTRGNVGVIFSSDYRDLRKALKISKIKYLEYKIESERVYMIRSGKLFLTNSYIKLSAPKYELNWRNYSEDYTRSDWSFELKEKSEDLDGIPSYESKSWYDLEERWNEELFNDLEELEMKELNFNQ